MKNKKEKKNRFSFFKKGALILMLGATLTAGCLGLTGCSDGDDGADGTNGTQWLTGETVPKVTQGVDGDFYYNTKTKILYQKTDDIWKAIVLDFGAKGDQGEQGIQGEKGETGAQGDDGKDGNTWIVGATKPTTSQGVKGDLYFDYVTKDVYQKVDGTWNKLCCLASGASSSSPITIASAEEFAMLGTSEEYTYYALTDNIDLRELNSTFVTNGKLASKFVGELNGNGHTITMNDEASFSNIFTNISGYFHDFVLHFPNIQDKEINFSSNIVGETKFKNITTTGSIVVPSSGSNWSPYVNFIKSADTTFENCTNSLDVVLPSYGSLFVGGYATDGNTNLRDPIDYEGYSSKGVLLGNVKLNFINCKNTANVEMEWASMLYGNNPRFPQSDDITITNCVNEGKILGYKGVGLFCGYSGFLTHVARYAYEYQDYYFDYGDYDPETGTKQGLLAKVGDNLKNSATGITAVISQKDLLETNEESNNFVIKNVTEGNNYEFKITMWGTRENEVTHGAESILVTLSKTYTATSNNDIDTGFEDLKFIDKWQYDAKTNKTTELCKTLKVELAGGVETTIYIVTDNNTSERFYYIDIISEGKIFDQVHGKETTVYEYNSSGTIIAKSI